MRRFCLLGVLVGMIALAGCASSSNEKVLGEKNNANRETDLLFAIRAAQGNYEEYLKQRADACKKDKMVLVRDGDGVLTCAAPPQVPANKTEENK